MTPWTVACQAPLSMEFSRQESWSGLPCPPPGIEPRSSSLQVDPLPYEPPGKPKNTGVGSLFLFQGIFPTGSNPSLPHCRWILYCLSHQGSPRILGWVACPFSRGSPYPRMEPGSPAMLAETELPGSPYVYSMHNIIYVFHETYEFLPSQKYFASTLLT